MEKVNDPRAVEGRITLHGLGFLVVQLPANQRMHVWHPELPKRKRLEQTWVHNHRFSFRSKVLVGSLYNVRWDAPAKGQEVYGDVFDEYSHAGARTAFGSRPWTPTGRKRVLTAEARREVAAGETYAMTAYDFHHTEVASSDGILVTLMEKCYEYDAPAASLCCEGVQPDEEFDRYQWAEECLWDVVHQCLAGSDRLCVCER